MNNGETNVEINKLKRAKGALNAKINKLLKQIESMKNCDNCKKFSTQNSMPFNEKSPCWKCDGIVPSHWELNDEV